MNTKRTSLNERFWAKVHKTDHCWLWTGCADRYGYGQLREGGRVCRLLKPHRVSWEIHNGPIPDGFHVLHRCDNPPCVRPDHLWLGTHSDNVADMVAKGRHQHGENSGNAKLTEADVVAIRASTGTVYAVGRQYGVNFSHISQIRRRKSWKHIPEDASAR